MGGLARGGKNPVKRRNFPVVNRRLHRLPRRVGSLGKRPSGIVRRLVEMAAGAGVSGCENAPSEAGRKRLGGYKMKGNGPELRPQRRLGIPSGAGAHVSPAGGQSIRADKGRGEHTVNVLADLPDLNRAEANGVAQRLRDRARGCAHQEKLSASGG
jgi:hypothetical protein